MEPENGKQLLIKHNEHHLQTFLRDDATKLTLPKISPSPFHAASSSANHYTKIDFSPKGPHRLRCIKENGQTHSWVWLTNGAKLKEAVRFGIIQPASLTGKLIATLGQYRHITHQRAVKGMMTQTQGLKVQLLDHYQDRLQLLSAFESMVNGDNNLEAYTQAFTTYCQQLDELKAKLQALHQTQLETLLPGTISLLENELTQAKKRAAAYLQDLQTCSTLNPTNRARGHRSILEHVEAESLQLLYEFQGLNQDLTFSRERRFALTRGELNDAIEDARGVIDKHRADPKNRVTQQHHQNYPDDCPIAFHFDPEQYSPDQERQALMAVSFIEGWDAFDPVSKTIKNEKNETETLDTITATKWQTHRSWTAFFKSVGYFLLNVIKGLILPTRPWDEEAWGNKDFHLFQHTLHQQSRPNRHIWWRVLYLIIGIGKACYDFVDGIRNFASNLVIRLPQALVDDWASTQQDLPLAQVYEMANQENKTLLATEAATLNEILTQWHKKHLDLEIEMREVTSGKVPLPAFAKPSYLLSVGEQNDLLTSMTRGLDGFATFFTHNIYSKDPVGGMIFTLAYVWGGAALYFPELSKVLFGEGYVNWFHAFAKTMGATQLAGTIAGGSTQAQLFFSVWEVLMHGPSAGPVETTKEILKDPITIAAGFWLAYGIGYLLANGINGHNIPGVSEYFKEEMGTIPDMTYPITGAKILITLYEILHNPHHPMLENIKKELETLRSNHSEVNQELERIQLLYWLHEHAESLPKLGRSIKFKLAQQIDARFNAEDAASLKTILYPEKPRSIAFQLFYIPLSYIPAVLRLITALCMSVVAWVQEKPHAWRPIQRAAKALVEKLGFDLNRLLIFTHEFLRLVFKCVACVFKAFVFTINLAIGRIGGLFKAHPGHYIHRAFAAIHRGFAWLREWFYPARATESVLIRHPTCTLEQYAAGHQKLMAELSAQPAYEPPNDHMPVRMWRSVETQTTMPDLQNARP